jgi:adenosylcobinamide kinase/adenosylcobinamide-phosphate guanylyltransferase
MAAVPNSAANRPPARELILGGQKSGKSRAAEGRAQRWLGIPDREAILIATARADDAEMAARIARHRADRAIRVPDLKVLEESSDLVSALTAQIAPHRLVIVDCLTLWLTQLLLPINRPRGAVAEHQTAFDALISAVRTAQGPVVIVSNEISLGVAPITAEARTFLDTIGALHQSLAAISERVTLMVAGCEVPIRRPHE